MLSFKLGALDAPNIEVSFAPKQPYLSEAFYPFDIIDLLKEPSITSFQPFYTVEVFMSDIDNKLSALIEAAGVNATNEQSDEIVSFITNHYPKDEWEWAAQLAIDIGEVYSDITMRLGECGMY